MSCLEVYCKLGWDKHVIYEINPFSDLIIFHLIDSNYHALMFDLYKEINLNLMFFSIHMTNFIILFHSSGKKKLQSYSYFKNHMIHVMFPGGHCVSSWMFYQKIFFYKTMIWYYISIVQNTWNLNICIILPRR